MQRAALPGNHVLQRKETQLQSFCRVVWAATFSAAATRCTSRSPSEDPARFKVSQAPTTSKACEDCCVSFLPRFRNSTSKTNDLNRCSEHLSAATAKRNCGFARHPTTCRSYHTNCLPRHHSLLPSIMHELSGAGPDGAVFAVSVIEEHTRAPFSMSPETTRPRLHFQGDCTQPREAEAKSRAWTGRLEMGHPRPSNTSLRLRLPGSLLHRKTKSIAQTALAV